MLRVWYTKCMQDISTNVAADICSVDWISMEALERWILWKRRDKINKCFDYICPCKSSYFLFYKFLSYSYHKDKSKIAIAPFTRKGFYHLLFIIAVQVNLFFNTFCSTSMTHAQHICTGNRLLRRTIVFFFLGGGCFHCKLDWELVYQCDWAKLG